MFNTIHSIAATIQNFVNRTEYVFKIFVWAVDALRGISAILASFPKPPVDVVQTEGTDGNKGAGDSQSGGAKSTDGKPVPDTPGQLAGGV